MLELGWRPKLLRVAGRDMGNSYGECRWANPPQTWHLPSPTSLPVFVCMGSASCMKESAEDGTGPEGNELSVPARNLGPAPSHALPGKEKHLGLIGC